MEMGRRRPATAFDPRAHLELPELAVLYAHAQFHGCFYGTSRLNFHTFAHTKFHPPNTYRLLTPIELLEDFTQRRMSSPAYTDAISTRISFMLATHIPSSPQRLPVADIWYYIVTEDNEELAFGIINYAAWYACQRFVLDTLNGLHYRWLTSTMIEATHPTSNHRLRIKSSFLEQIFEYEPTAEESRFRFTYPDNKLIHRLNNFHTINPPPFVHTPTPAPTTSTPTKRPNHDRHKSRTPATTAGATTVAQIADSLGMSSNLARNILRKINTPKPAHGRWEFTDPDDIAKITAILKQGAR